MDQLVCVEQCKLQFYSTLPLWIIKSETICFQSDQDPLRVRDPDEVREFRRPHSKLPRSPPKTMCPSLSFLMRNWLHGPRGVTMRVERSFPQRTTLPGNNQSDQSSGSRPRRPQCPAARRKPDPPHPVPRKNRLALPPPKYPHPGRTGLGPPAEETRCPR